MNFGPNMAASSVGMLLARFIKQMCSPAYDANAIVGSGIFLEECPADARSCSNDNDIHVRILFNLSLRHDANEFVPDASRILWRIGEFGFLH